MKQKIKGYILNTNANIICKKESMDKYLNIFSQYFDNVGNCITDINLMGFSNTILCYCKTSKLQNCTDCSGGCMEIPDKWNFGPADSIWEHIHNNQEKPDFMRVEVKDYTRKLCDGSLVISLKNSEYNRVIAEFCPVKKIMLTTDWTNDDSKLVFVFEFFSIMEDAGLLNKKLIERRRPTVTLGTDPEFEYIDPDTDEILSCRDMGIMDRVIVPGVEGGRIGRDGCGHQRELRPEPATSPEGLIQNIEKLIQAGLDEKWSLKGERFSCGGHIHVGGVTESKEFGRLLDYYLGPLGVLNSRIRLDSEYGKVGSQDSVRKQPYGMEYRTPPVGWLASKELATITLKIVKLAADKHFYGEDIDITDNIGSDLETLGLTESEVKTFFDEINKYKTMGLPRDLKEAWGYKTPPKFVIEFRDTWNEDVREYIENIVRKMAAEEQLGGRCVFYVLSSERGNVFSVVMAHMNGIDMPETYGFMPPLKVGAGKNHVGMPDILRKSLSEAKKMEDMILEIVKRTINPPKIEKKILKKKIIRKRAIVRPDTGRLPEE